MSRDDADGLGGDADVDAADGDAADGDADADVDAADEDVRSRANESRTEAGDGDGREWRFALDDVGPDGVTEDTTTPEDEPIEPGDVELEHAVFVALGVAITVGVFVVGF